MIKTKHHGLLKNAPALLNRIEHRLSRNGVGQAAAIELNSGKIKGSAVLFLLTSFLADREIGFEPCLLLNKRSQHILQPGDLCCPGGGVERRDQWLSRILRWPFSPLGKWAQWKTMKTENSRQAQQLALLLTTGLREAWEEMRLNPLRVRFLGPLSKQRLIMFDRVIHPLAGWIPNSRHLSANWEVERIVHIPLRRLLDHRNYGRYRLVMDHQGQTVQRKDDFPCFVHNGRQGKELLWGATLRITIDFLNRVFDFELPPLNGTPVYAGRLGQTYLNGSLLSRGPMPQEMHKEDY